MLQLQRPPLMQSMLLNTVAMAFTIVVYIVKPNQLLTYFRPVRPAPSVDFHTTHPKHGAASPATWYNYRCHYRVESTNNMFQAGGDRLTMVVLLITSRGGLIFACRLFEFDFTIPQTCYLQIQVMDYDRLSADDLIGETIIDLENRFLSKYRASCGLAQQYDL